MQVEIFSKLILLCSFDDDHAPIYIRIWVEFDLSLMACIDESFSGAHVRECVTMCLPKHMFSVYRTIPLLSSFKHVPQHTLATSTIVGIWTFSVSPFLRDSVREPCRIFPAGFTWIMWLCHNFDSKLGVSTLERRKWTLWNGRTWNGREWTTRKWNGTEGRGRKRRKGKGREWRRRNEGKRTTDDAAFSLQVSAASHNSSEFRRATASL